MSEVIWKFGEIPADAEMEECRMDASGEDDEEQKNECAVKEITAGELRRIKKNGGINI